MTRSRIRLLKPNCDISDIPAKLQGRVQTPVDAGRIAEHEINALFKQLAGKAKACIRKAREGKSIEISPPLSGGRHFPRGAFDNRWDSPNDDD